ncbi:5-formyltetrahydrofolate cyclo-ligase [Corynebacterium sp. ES2794-CONJ1]|uniref:5-formyltetrahydrofolate cyclo-ligase n=1 Tax=Corynebacterium sp. ES2794-CONJ1 TaxID=2980553 RepID=UPI0021D86C1E|nr:5-formyltetrahydrofolate cyclo-ligase [Corynebacterium sp. ES2794-CONJ1]MCU9519127.1 5-formyltetrahydrofolate cyclo-ligase [Corynebacterium sp. ES2794-CONJ1]
MNSAAAKSVMRDKVRRARISKDCRSENAQISGHLVKFLRDYHARAVAAYAPLPHEPGFDFVAPLAAALEQLWLPRVAQRHQLRWGLYQGPASLEKSSCGIREPRLATRDVAVLGELDAVVVPGLSYSPSGERLGQGGGFYDRALADRPTLLIGVCFASEVQPIVVEAHDCRVDIILTENGTADLRCES